MNGKQAVFTFDLVTVTTIRVATSDDSEAAARQAMAGLASLDLDALVIGVDGNVPDDTRFDVTCVSPRGSAWLVHATGANGEDVAVAQDAGLSEPLPGDSRDELAEAVRNAEKAMRGDSGGTEHEALLGLTREVRSLLGLPEGDDDKDEKENR